MPAKLSQKLNRFGALKIKESFQTDFVSKEIP